LPNIGVKVYNYRSIIFIIYARQQLMTSIINRYDTSILSLTVQKNRWVQISLTEIILRTYSKMLITIEALDTWGNESSKPDFTFPMIKTHRVCSFKKVQFWL